MINNTLYNLKQNIEFYSIDIEVVDSFDKFLKHINQKKHYVLTNFENRTFYKVSEFKNMHTFSDKVNVNDAPLLFFIEANNSLLQKYNKLLLNIASNYYKNPYHNVSTIAACFDEAAIDMLINVINFNPCPINKLYINNFILEYLNSHFC